MTYLVQAQYILMLCIYVVVNSLVYYTERDQWPADILLCSVSATVLTACVTFNPIAGDLLCMVE